MDEHVTRPLTPPIKHRGGLRMTDDIRRFLYGRSVARQAEKDVTRLMELP